MDESLNNDAIIELENKFYISANSSYADTSTRLLNHADTFGIFDRWGDIMPVGQQIHGIYHEGTRFINISEFRINNERPLLLSSSVKEENEILSVDLTNPLITHNDGLRSVPKAVIHISRSKFIRNGACYERIEFLNFSTEQHFFKASISFHADFRDIFEIRGMKREKQGEIFEIKHIDDKTLVICYRGLDGVERSTEIMLRQSPDHWDNHEKAAFNITLEPHQHFVIEYSMNFLIGEQSRYDINYSVAETKMESDLESERNKFAHVFTSNEQLNHWINRSQADLISLLAPTREGNYPYAGVPWYNTPFGRDGIITALETLWTAPNIARDVLLFLARYQATEINPNQDAEPGKIMHEMRGGEMVKTQEIPFGLYYGSVDSTPLFLVLAGAYYQRTADMETIQSIWKNIEAALHWIDSYGDIDKDGFVEYQHKSLNGLTNQGWKDSQDAISDEEGKLAEAPIALCEVQGYVYDAKLNIAKLASVLKKKSLADKLRREAQQLKVHFHESFWDPDLETYVLALDGNKRPCRVRSSNAGHCLFSGIAKNSVAAKQVKSLMNEDMFSGWGIRTLSSREVRYNPMSYHNGSVWPHDVALIAKGFAQYGFSNEAIKLTGALFDASLFIELQRLPELFCGFPRRKGEGPTAYPVACSPQAWSVGAVFMLLETCLYMEINAPEKKVYFNKPILPGYMDNILIKNLQLGDSRVSIELHRYKEDTGILVKNQPKDWDIVLMK